MQDSQNQKRDAPAPPPTRAPNRTRREFSSATQALRRRVLEWIVEHFLLVMGLAAVISMLLVLGFMLKDAVPLLWDHVPDPATGQEARLNLWRFLTGDTWRPGGTPERLEILVLMIGSALVTVGASIIAIPIGFACAVYLAELAPRVVRETVKPVVEMLAAIPSVVIGFIGFSYLNGFLRTYLDGSGPTSATAFTAVVGALVALTLSVTAAFITMGGLVAVLSRLRACRTRSWLMQAIAAVPAIAVGAVVGYYCMRGLPAWHFGGGFHFAGVQTGLMAFTASVMLAFMAMPTIISISEDALSAVPKSYREGSLALGASPLATIRHAVWPAARSGLIAAAMLGVGRALGETMVVLMVGGGAKANPYAFLGEPGQAVDKLNALLLSGFGFFKPISTMTAVIATETREAAPGTPHYHALFAMGAILCLISFAITLVSDLALRRKKA